MSYRASFESRADRRGRGRPQGRGGGRQEGRGGRSTRGGTSPIRTRPPPTAEKTASETAPPGSPIADRLAKPAGPGWTTLTPAQAAIKVRYPPLPALCITPPVVTGHVKEPEGPRTRAHSRTGFPFRNTLLPRDKGPPKVPSLAPHIISNTAGPVASHAHPLCTLTLAPRNTIAPEPNTIIPDHTQYREPIQPDRVLPECTARAPFGEPLPLPHSPPSLQHLRLLTPFSHSPTSTDGSPGTLPSEPLSRTPAALLGPIPYTTDECLTNGCRPPPQEGESALGITHLNCCDAPSYSGSINALGDYPVNAAHVNGRQPA